MINNNSISEISNLVFQVRGDKNDSFGTAFAVLAKDGCTYFVTCQHVIEEIESQNITIGLEYKAHIVVYDEVKDGFDVTVLKIDVELDLPYISLSIDLIIKNKMVCVGFFLNGAKQKVIKPVSGKIANDTGFVESKKFNKRIKYWELDIESSSSKLQKGYSGSPVIDTNTNSIIGLVNMMMNSGEKGAVISIEVLKIILPRLEHTITQKDNSLRLSKKENIYDFQLNSDNRHLMEIVFSPKYSPEYDFFYQRSDSIFEKKIDFFMQMGRKNVWIYGNSGVGKTTLLVRKALKSEKKFHYYYASSLISTSDVFDIFNDLYSTLEPSSSLIKEDNYIRKIASLIIERYDSEEVVFLIDEFDFINNTVFAVFVSSIVALSQEYQNLSSNGNKLVFWISTINNPIQVCNNLSKIKQHFDFEEIPIWGRSDLSFLLECILKVLNLELTDNKKSLILDNFSNPRDLKEYLYQARNSINIEKKFYTTKSII